MDYTKSATPLQTKFITGWNNLLSFFDKVLFSIPEHENLRIFILLINKINSNCQAAINLIDQGFINEGLMIFRSAIETVIYARYLKLFPEEQKIFFDLSDLFLIKNQFIQYKEIKNNKIHISSDIKVLLQTIEDNIRQLFKTNEPLRKKFPTLTLKFDENDIKTLDKFFQGYKFPTQNVYDKLRKIKEREPQFANTPFDLYGIYYAYYDENSAILHGNERYWNEQPQLDRYYLGIITSHLLRILVVATDLVQHEIPANIYHGFSRAIQQLKELELTELSTPAPAFQNPHDLQQDS